VSALAVAATALIVPGTGTPNANIAADYREHARDYYMQGTVCTNDSDCAPNNTGDPAAGGILGVNYPATFWPVPVNNWCPGLTCDTWNVSVSQGVDALNTALTDSRGPAVIFGYSQGGAVVSNELSNIANDPDLLAKIDRVITIGGIDNPDGGAWSRLSFLRYIPILNLTTGPAMPTGLPGLEGKFDTVGFQYDPVVYSPLYWGNPVSVLNALAALVTVHGYYLADVGTPLAYGYNPTDLADEMNCTLHKENCRVDEYGNTYVMIPARGLPLTNLVMSAVPDPLKPVVQPFADLATPVLKVIADLGYDWSGDPSQVRVLSPLPFNPSQNWIGVAQNLAAATAQGVQAFLTDLGVGAPAVTGVTSTNNSSTNSTMRALSFAAELTGNDDDVAGTLSKNGIEGETAGPGTRELPHGHTGDLQDEGDQTVIDKAGVATDVVGSVIEKAQPEGSMLSQEITKVDENGVEEDDNDSEELKKGSEEVKRVSEQNKQGSEENKQDLADVQKGPAEVKKVVRGGPMKFSPKKSGERPTAGGGVHDPASASPSAAAGQDTQGREDSGGSGRSDNSEKSAARTGGRRTVG